VLDFTALGRAVARRVKALLLLEGSATPRLVAAIATAGGGPTLHGPFRDLSSALATARELAVAGDTVLLSPGCASFGMFRNEFHRGEEFRRLVGELPE